MDDEDDEEDDEADMADSESETVGDVMAGGSEGDLELEWESEVALLIGLVEGDSSEEALAASPTWRCYRTQCGRDETRRAS